MGCLLAGVAVAPASAQIGAPSLGGFATGGASIGAGGLSVPVVDPVIGGGGTGRRTGAVFLWQPSAAAVSARTKMSAALEAASRVCIVSSITSWTSRADSCCPTA